MDSLVYSTASNMAMLIAGIALVWWAIWFFFFRRKLKKYNVDIYKLIHIDQKNDPLLVYDRKDILKEVVYGKPERHIFKLITGKVEVEPPNQNVIYIKNKKDHVDLLMMDSLLYIPFSKRFSNNEIIEKFMDYDINMFRIQSESNRDEFYSEQKTFMEKIGPILGIILCIICVTVIGFLAFDFFTKIQASSIGPITEIANNLRSAALGHL